MKRIGLIIVASGALLPARPASAAPPDVSQLEAAIDVMGDCKALADEIGAMRVPDKFAKVRAAADHNRKAGDPVTRVTVAAAQAAFLAKMEESVARLEACGVVYRVTLPAAETRLAAIAADDSLSDADATSIAAVVDGYQDAKEALAASISALSTNRQIQAQVYRVLSASFLAQAAKGGK